jgi:hypothetical protein
MKLEMVEGSIVVVEEAGAAGKKNNSYCGDITSTAYRSRPKQTFLYLVYLLFHSIRIFLFDM